MAANEIDATLREQMKRLDSLVRGLEESRDPGAARAREIVQGLLDFHGAAIARLMDRVAESGAAGEQVFDSLGRDELVSSMLVLYGLHPFDVETRVRWALERAEPVLARRGAAVKLMSIDTAGGGVKLELGGNLHCQSTLASVKSAVEEVVMAAAPEIEKVEIVSSSGGSGNGFVAATSVQLNGRPIAAGKVEEACT